MKSKNKRKNKKQVYTKISLIILSAYVLIAIMFPVISLKISNNSIARIVLVLIVIYFTINIRKFNIDKKKIKQVTKNYIKFINENVLAKSITILIIINLLTNILNILIKNISTK